MTTILITGASMGIGAELARALASPDSRLVLVARSRDRLEVIAKELVERCAEVIVVTADLMQPDAVPTLMAELQNRGLEVDFLVNNAGYGKYGLFEEIPIVEQLGE